MLRQALLDSVHVRFTPKATRLLRSSGMSRRATSGQIGLWCKIPGDRSTRTAGRRIGSTHRIAPGRNAMAEARPKSSMHGVSHVPEFIGIAHDIDADDALSLDLQGGSLENVRPARW
jgi:hypothetical protein